MDNAGMTPHDADPNVIRRDTADFDFEGGLSLKQVAEMGLVPGRSPDKPSGHSVLQDYARDGCYPVGRDGPCVILPTVWFSNSRWTMRSWVDWFNRQRVACALKAAGRRRRAESQGDQGPRERTPRQREAAQARARARLEAQGVLPVLGLVGAEAE